MVLHIVRKRQLSPSITVGSLFQDRTGDRGGLLSHPAVPPEKAGARQAAGDGDLHLGNRTRPGLFL